MELKAEKIGLSFCFVLVAYLLINTGVVSDDFIYIAQAKTENFIDTLTPSGVWLLTPIENYTHRIWYRPVSLDNTFVIDFLKMLYAAIALYMVYKFFRIYLGHRNSLVVAVLFIFFPSHDSTVYWFLESPLTLTIAIYMYSFYLAYKDKLVLAFLLAAFASFLSYGSSTIAFSLSLLFLLHKNFKKAFILLAPNLIYIFYYFLTARVAGLSARIGTDINTHSFAKLFLLQCATFIDAVIGPSMWLKVYYSISQISIISLVIGAVLIIIFYAVYRGNHQDKYNARLIASMAFFAVLSLAMFAITGRYPQLAFNLGNRTTIFGSLVIAYLVVTLPVRREVKTIIFALFMLSILGISDHWKTWSLHQQEVVREISNNEELKNYNDNRVLYVTGNQYSKLGKICHIEFFCEGGITEPVFKIALGRDVTVQPINKRYKYRDGYLIDTKYNIKDKVDGHINVYDSEKRALFMVDAEDINRYIASLPTYYRHWSQLMDVGPIKRIAVKFMPRLEYAL